MVERLPPNILKPKLLRSPFSLARCECERGTELYEKAEEEIEIVEGNG
jgi:hypothetical protein